MEDATITKLREEFREELRKERQRAEDERRLRKLAEAQAEQEKKQLQHERQRADQAEGRAKQAEEKTRRTTFEELLESCHKLLGSVSVQTDKSMSTQGSTTSPEGKYCPKLMLPWTEFPRKRQDAFEQLYKILHPPKGPARQLFSPLLHFKSWVIQFPAERLLAKRTSRNSIKLRSKTPSQMSSPPLLPTTYTVRNGLLGRGWYLTTTPTASVIWMRRFEIVYIYQVLQANLKAASSLSLPIKYVY